MLVWSGLIIKLLSGTDFIPVIAHGLPWWLSGKEPACRRMGSIPGEEEPLEKMSTHSSILAWEIPRTEEPGRLQSVGLQNSQS